MMHQYTISGIQQIGIGVADLDQAWAWYRKFFGMTALIFRDKAPAPLMTPYTGGQVHYREAALALNMQGGSGFEIWQYTSRQSQKADFEAKLGDLGLFSARIKARYIEKAYNFFKEQKPPMLSSLETDPSGNAFFYTQDPYNNLFQVVQGGQDFFARDNHPTGGPEGMLIGVSDIDQALFFYQRILGFDTIVYDQSGVFVDLRFLPGGKDRLRRVLLTHRQHRSGFFSPLFGKARVELVQNLDKPGRKIFAKRYWGDQGFIHLCFDIHNMAALRRKCQTMGYPFTIDSQDTFDMGDAGGHFSYIEDGDGSLIEFVETHRVPILKKLGIFLDLRKRNPHKPLPNFMLKAMGLNRHK